MLVCQCLAVSEHDVRRAVEQGASTIEELTGLCGAGGGCGTCHVNLSEVLVDALGVSTYLRAS